MNTMNFKKNNFFGNKFIFAALGISLALMASAQDFDSGWSFFEPVAQTTRFGISPFYGYRFGGGIKDDTTGMNYNFADAPAYGLVLDYAPTNSFGHFELLWSRQDSSVDFQGNYGLGKVDITIDVVQVGGELEYGSDRFRGYISVDLGATILGQTDTEMTPNLAGASVGV